MDPKNDSDQTYVPQLFDDEYKNALTNVLTSLVTNYYQANDLATQEKFLKNKGLKRALPAMPEGTQAPPKILFHLLGDLEKTVLFDKFEQWVSSLGKQIIGPQERKLGAIVQVSGYGKTHLARTFTSVRRAVYILFTHESAAAMNSNGGVYTSVVDFFNKQFQIFADAENTLANVDLTDDFVANKEFARVFRVSDLCRRILRLFLLAAIEFYTEFLQIAAPIVAHHANSNGKDHPHLLKLGSLLFNNGCLHFFLNMKLPALFNNYHNDTWWASYSTHVQAKQKEYQVGSIFCDEVHGLLNQHVALAFHEHVHANIPSLPKLVVNAGIRRIFDRYDTDKEGGTFNKGKISHV